MIIRALKILSIGILLLVLAIPLRAQNTKGDKPVSNRENRFKKTVKKEKPAKRIRSNKRTTSSLRAYKPRKKSRGGERAGRPLSPTYTSRPSERQSRNVFPQRGPYVNNPSRKPRETQRRNTAPEQRRISARSSSGRVRNVYPQTGRFVNHSSAKERPPGKKRRVKPRSASHSFVARRSVNAWANFPRAKQKKERAYKGDISGRRIRTKNFETKRPAIIKAPSGTSRFRSPKTKNIYSQSRRFSTPSRRRQSANVYPQRGPYVNNPSRKPRNVQTAVSNRSTLARLNRLQNSYDRKPGKKRRVTPRSASGSYIARRSTNVWAHFPRPKHKGERAYTKDIAGRPLRTKNFETKRPAVLINPTARPYKSKKKIGDQPYSGRAGRYSTATRSGRSWRGDITNRKIRGKNLSSKKTVEGKATMSPLKKRAGLDRFFKGRLKGGGFKSRSGEKRTGLNPVPVRPPGIGGKGLDKYQGTIRQRRGFGNQGEEYSGNIKSRRSAKGGGSVSGRLWNNKGTAIPARTPGKGARGIGNYKGNVRRLEGQGKGFLDQGEGYTGSVRARRPPKGGGSVSGKLWNNRRTAIAPRTPGMGANRIEKFQGNIKRGRPEKGGGSVSGRLWNNRQTPVPGKTPGIGADRIGKFQGNIKRGRPDKGGGSVSGKLWNNRQTPVPARAPGIGADKIGKFQGNVRRRRPDKGGGSVSGKLWNNRQTPIPARTPGIGADRIGKFQGNIKRDRAQKGGGSISGKLWNNKETAIPTRAPSRQAAKASGYPGKIRMFQQKPGFNDQGEEYSGSIKARRPPKGGGSVSGKLWNNRETPIAVRVPKSEQGGESRGKLKQKAFVKNPNAAELALKKSRPKTTYLTDGLQMKVKERPHGNRKNAPEGSLAGIKPSKETVRAGEYTGEVRRNWRYMRNPNSADVALKKRKPETANLTGGLQVKVRQRPFGNRKNAPEGSLPGLKPTKESVRAGEYARGVRKTWNYVRNPNSADDAMKTREPGKAFARASDYQGNIKMRKFDLFGKRGLHPDAQFVKTNKNNVAGEKDMMTNFKLWWSRLFKKNDTQPDHLKDKRGKPRYDKGEQGLWYD